MFTHYRKPYHYKPKYLPHIQTAPQGQSFVSGSDHASLVPPPTTQHDQANDRLLDCAKFADTESATHAYEEAEAEARLCKNLDVVHGRVRLY